jgi:hypothetical protein
MANHSSRLLSQAARNFISDELYAIHLVEYRRAIRIQAGRVSIRSDDREERMFHQVLLDNWADDTIQDLLAAGFDPTEDRPHIPGNHVGISDIIRHTVICALTTSDVEASENIIRLLCPESRGMFDYMVDLTKANLRAIADANVC